MKNQTLTAETKLLEEKPTDEENKSITDKITTASNPSNALKSLDISNSLGSENNSDNEKILTSDSKVIQDPRLVPKTLKKKLMGRNRKRNRKMNQEKQIQYAYKYVDKFKTVPKQKIHLRTKRKLKSLNEIIVKHEEDIQKSIEIPKCSIALEIPTCSTALEISTCSTESTTVKTEEFVAENESNKTVANHDNEGETKVSTTITGNKNHKEMEKFKKTKDAYKFIRKHQNVPEKDLEHETKINLKMTKKYIADHEAAELVTESAQHIFQRMFPILEKYQGETGLKISKSIEPNQNLNHQSINEGNENAILVSKSLAPDSPLVQPNIELKENLKHLFHFKYISKNVKGLIKKQLKPKSESLASFEQISFYRRVALRVIEQFCCTPYELMIEDERTSLTWARKFLHTVEVNNVQNEYYALNDPKNLPTDTCTIVSEGKYILFEYLSHTYDRNRISRVNKQYWLTKNLEELQNKSIESLTKVQQLTLKKAQKYKAYRDEIFAKESTLLTKTPPEKFETERQIFRAKCMTYNIVRQLRDKPKEQLTNEEQLSLKQAQDTIADYEEEIRKRLSLCNKKLPPPKRQICENVTKEDEQEEPLVKIPKKEIVQEENGYNVTNMNHQTLTTETKLLKEMPRDAENKSITDNESILHCDKTAASNPSNTLKTLDTSNSLETENNNSAKEKILTSDSKVIQNPSLVPKTLKKKKRKLRGKRKRKMNQEKQIQFAYENFKKPKDAYEFIRKYQNVPKKGIEHETKTHLKIAKKYIADHEAVELVTESAQHIFQRMFPILEKYQGETVLKISKSTEPNEDLNHQSISEGNVDAMDDSKPLAPDSPIVQSNLELKDNLKHLFYFKYISENVRDLFKKQLQPDSESSASFKLTGFYRRVAFRVIEWFSNTPYDLMIEDERTSLIWARKFLHKLEVNNIQNEYYALNDPENLPTDTCTIVSEGNYVLFEYLSHINNPNRISRVNEDYWLNKSLEELQNKSIESLTEKEQCTLKKVQRYKAFRDKKFAKESTLLTKTPPEKFETERQIFRAKCMTYNIVRQLQDKPKEQLTNEEQLSLEQAQDTISDYEEEIRKRLSLCNKKLPQPKRQISENVTKEDEQEEPLVKIPKKEIVQEENVKDHLFLAVLVTNNQIGISQLK